MGRRRGLGSAAIAAGHCGLGLGCRQCPGGQAGCHPLKLAHNGVYARPAAD